MKIIRTAMTASLIVAPTVIGAARAATPVERVREAPHSRAISRERSVWDSVFTAEQAKRGETLYRQSCARCHKDSLQGDDVAASAPLTGKTFLSNWDGTTVADLHERVLTTMPSDSVGTLNRQQVSDLVAYLFSFNGFPAGTAELASDAAVLKEIRIEAKKR